MTSTLPQISKEIDSLAKVSGESMLTCLDETQSLLDVLRAAQAALIADDDSELNKLPVRVNAWSNAMIKSLKMYNTGLTLFNVKVVESGRTFEFRLDDLYKYPLGEGTNVQRMVTKSIIMHLVRNNTDDGALLHLVRRLEQQFNLEVSAELVDGFRVLNDLVSAILVDHTLRPVIDWCEANHEALIHELNSDLEFQLHKLQFLIHYNSGSTADAIGPDGLSRFLAYKYARENFQKFGVSHLQVVLKLLSSLLYAAETETNPYRSLVDLQSSEDTQLVMRQKIVSLLVSNFCALVLRLSPRSLLEEVLLASYRALPQFVKFHKLLKVSANLDWTTENELPFETPYDYDEFHQVFICPVSKEQTVHGVNPPMSLPCRHILSKESIWKLSRNLTTSFKCPYCPEICSPENTFEVKFVNL
ncbi:hypothetical protein BABINDRAFT_175853 [Babjeviella inositovora NRRL Y-12698]|uniref:RING-Gid-type domain-containing protein n=1 Tax=Babjeviella inositovora NRRL Y-12698 TaxID=984486 RepID=A0A1E3QPP3_9ASCO|nr:uncharacterized protein BABINDRAFT_175853 [Babjeviella inositovora NRRL Y-12698]ODQ79676.1 hypothetical protein BABINDRAFT_175853 [Babjeviella inositovora NRRL Y-12698]